MINTLCKYGGPLGRSSGPVACEARLVGPLLFCFGPKFLLVSMTGVVEVHSLGDSIVVSCDSALVKWCGRRQLQKLVAIA